MVSPIEEAYIKIKALNEIIHILEGQKIDSCEEMLGHIYGKRDWYIKLKETLEGMIKNE